MLAKVAISSPPEACGLLRSFLCHRSMNLPLKHHRFQSSVSGYRLQPDLLSPAPVSSSSRTFSTTTSGNSTSSQIREQEVEEFSSPNPDLVDASCAPEDYVDGSAVVYENFFTSEESDALASDLTKRLKRRRYEKGHWDAVIVKYKETELFDEASFLSETSQQVFDRVRKQLLAKHFSEEQRGKVKWLPCHAIDYHKDGALNAHVDSVRYSGEVVSGLSLLSNSIMRLRPAPDDDDGDGHEDEATDGSYTRKMAKQPQDERELKERGYVDLFLPPLSLYVLSGVSRYNYTHEMLPSGATFCKHAAVERDHRLSVIFRDAKI